MLYSAKESASEELSSNKYPEYFVNVSASFPLLEEEEEEDKEARGGTNDARQLEFKFSQLSGRPLKQARGGGESGGRRNSNIGRTGMAAAACNGSCGGSFVVRFGLLLLVVLFLLFILFLFLNLLFPFNWILRFRCHFDTWIESDDDAGR